MNAEPGNDRSIEVVERVLTILSDGRFSSIYKHAVLLALIQLCQEGAARSGGSAAPDHVTTLQLAERVLENLWPHTRPFGERVLKSNSGRQAQIIDRIKDFQDRHGLASRQDLRRAAARHPVEFEKLLREIERVLVVMPLPRLQVVGDRCTPVLYDIGWDRDSVDRGSTLVEYNCYAKGRPSAFDNRIWLRPGVAAALVRLGGVLIPLIQREWARWIAKFNALPQDELHAFLFGSNRADLARIRGPLTEVQGGLCFYCGDRLKERVVVDHFLPWSKHPDDGIHNLVGADPDCNARKSDYFAASMYLGPWRERLEKKSIVARRLAEIAVAEEWPHDAERTLRVARSLYFRLPEETPLWRPAGEFELLERDVIARVLG